MECNDDQKAACGYRFGKIDATLAANGQTLGRIEKVCTSTDERLRTVEVKAARNGLIAGGAMATSIALIKEGIKAALKLGS